MRKLLRSWGYLFTATAMLACSESRTPTAPSVERVDRTRSVVPLGADDFYDAGDIVTIVAHEASGGSVPIGIIQNAETAVQRWNSILELQGYENDLPALDPDVKEGTSASGTFARLVYEDDCVGSECGYCGSFNGEPGGIREIRLSRKPETGSCTEGQASTGRIVDDPTGVITHEISHILGFGHTSGQENIWCTTNVPEEGNLNPFPCRWEAQSVYAAYNLRSSDPVPEATIANRLVILVNPDTILTGESETVTAVGLVDPEPSENVDAGGEPEAPWVLPPDTITVPVDWDDDASSFFSVTDLNDGDAQIDGTQVGQDPLAVVAEDHADDSVTSAFPWPVDTATIVVESASGLVPCFEEDTTQTWLATDQYLTAGCGSTGPNIEYRWRFEDGGAWTSFSSDTIHEFFGHGTADTHQVTLEVKDTSSGSTEQFSKDFTVFNETVSMTGPTYVTTKQTKTYESTWAGSWYERYDPENLFAWYFAGVSDDTIYNRIWPAGDYTRRLRVEVPDTPYVGRDWLDVVVCHESEPGCGAQFWVLEQSESPDGLPVFGGSPWIDLGHRLVRFYDLTGLHEPHSPFAGAEWLDATGPREATDANGRVVIDWEIVSRTSDTRVVEFRVGQVAGAYTFGIALDPDLGSSPADDRTQYDPASGAVIAFDGTEALGIVLRRNDQNDLVSVKQYGADRFAPRNSSELRAASRETSVDLATSRDDVQFWLSAGEATGPATWELLIARGQDPTAVLQLLGDLERR